MFITMMMVGLGHKTLLIDTHRNNSWDDVIPAAPAHIVFNEDWIPSMPCATFVSDEHRVKNPTTKCCFNAMVTRPVTRKETLNSPKAMESFMKEWKGLWDQEVFDFSTTREYDDVVSGAEKKGEKVHMARVCMYSFMRRTISSKKMIRRGNSKGGVSYSAIKSRTRTWKQHCSRTWVFSPATFDASRWAAIQAYIQAKLSGVPCWVELPDDAWHPSANKHKFRRPVCRLVKALYGHPDAGTMWEQHCHTAVQKVGFKRLGEEWTSLYFHPDLKLLLVVYVDDLKMAGPIANLPKGWAMLCHVLKTKHRWVCILVVVSPRVRQYCMTRQKCKQSPMAWRLTLR